MDENNNPINENDNNQAKYQSRSGEGSQGQTVSNDINNQGQTTNVGQNYNNYNQNLNQANKKKSKAPLIIGIVCGVLLFGCLVFGIIFAIIGVFVNGVKDKVNNELNNMSYNYSSSYNNITNRVSNLTSNKLDTNSLNDLLNKTKNLINATNSAAVNNTTNNTTANNTVQNNNATNLDVKTSKQSAPISKGEWGAASKYDAKTSDYKDAYVKVTKFVRGEDAVKLVKEYTDSSSYYKYTEPKEGMEYVVVEYEVDFSNFEIPSYGISLDLSPSAKGTTEGQSAIKYNGVNYYVTATSMNKDYAKQAKATGKFAVQVPKGCTDYVVSFGSYGKTITYVKGE